MAKKMRKFISLLLVAVLMLSYASTGVSARERGDNDRDDNWNWGWPWPGGGQSSSYEWYEVYVQGKLVASGQGEAGDVYFLGTHYEAGYSIDGMTLRWEINPYGVNHSFGDTVDLTEYIGEIPEGYEIGEVDRRRQH